MTHETATKIVELDEAYGATIDLVTELGISLGLKPFEAKIVSELVKAAITDAYRAGAGHKGGVQ